MKNIILTISFILIMATGFIGSIIMKDQKVSSLERRYLKTFPELSTKTIKDGTFFSEFDTYTTDQFFMRNNLRKINAFYQIRVLNKLDYNGYKLSNNKIYKLDYPLKENKILNFTKKINYLDLNYFSNARKVAYTVIPDKSYYLDDYSLKYDYQTVRNILKDNLNINEIKIDDLLNMDSYYNTDIHWKEEKIIPVAKKIGEYYDVNIETEYEKKVYPNFIGSYYSGLGSLTKKDNLIYLTNSAIENIKVSDIENKIDQVYMTSKLGKTDSYDVYLGGATPIVTMVNSQGTKGKELIIFRDSFGSSLAPLLISEYEKITLVDLRYIDSSLLNNYLNFDNKDILLIYHTEIINNSDIIKVKIV